MIEFQAFPKIPRVLRDMVVTEKIDGTNAAIGIQKFKAGTAGSGLPAIVFAPPGDPAHEYVIYCQSRRRIITPDDDNYGFARWVYGSHAELARILGPGLHFGEWWGSGINRGYGLDHKRFSLFNTHRWGWLNDEHASQMAAVPAGLGCVPVLRTHTLDTSVIRDTLLSLALSGSQAAPGYMRPEGVVVYHTAGGALFKATLENDAAPKSAARPELALAA